MVFVAGQKVRASELNAIVGAYSISRVPSDFSKVSSTAYSDVSGLSIALAANAIYALDGAFAYNANDTADIKFALAAPSGATGWWSLYPMVQTATGVAGSLEAFRLDGFGDANGQGAGGGSTFGGTLNCRPAGYIVTSATAGNLTFRMAQVTSNVTAAIVKAGSWLRVTRLA